MTQFKFLKTENGMDYFDCGEYTKGLLDFMFTTVPNCMDSNVTRTFTLYDASANKVLVPYLKDAPEAAYYIAKYIIAGYTVELQSAGYYEGRRTKVGCLFSEPCILAVWVDTYGKNLQTRFENEIFYGI